MPDTFKALVDNLADTLHLPRSSLTTISSSSNPTSSTASPHTTTGPTTPSHSPAPSTAPPVLLPSETKTIAIASRMWSLEHRQNLAQKGGHDFVTPLERSIRLFVLAHGALPQNDFAQADAAWQERFQAFAATMQAECGFSTAFRAFDWLRHYWWTKLVVEGVGQGGEDKSRVEKARGVEERRRGWADGIVVEGCEGEGCAESLGLLEGGWRSESDGGVEGGGDQEAVDEEAMGEGEGVMEGCGEEGCGEEGCGEEGCGEVSCEGDGLRVVNIDVVRDVELRRAITP